MNLFALVISDSHGRADRVAALVARTRPDMLLFLGDGLRDLDSLDASLDVRAVRGNCDLVGTDAPYSRIVEIAGFRLALTHGHREGVKYGEQAAIEWALSQHADALLYGHTHRTCERTYGAGTTLGGTTLTKPFTVLCPGSIGEHDATFATLTFTPSGILTNISRL